MYWGQKVIQGTFNSLEGQGFKQRQKVIFVCKKLIQGSSDAIQELKKMQEFDNVVRNTVQYVKITERISI